MQDNLLLLCSPCDKLFRSMAKALVPCGNRVQQMHDVLDAPECIEALAPTIILVDMDQYPGAKELIEDFGTSTPIVALTRGTGIEHWDSLLCALGTPHIVAIPEAQAGPGAWRPLAVAIEKIHRRDFFGLDKYLSGFGVELNRILVRSADQREDVLHALGESLLDLQFTKRLIHSIQNGADELITNAVYNAPRDAHGGPQYAHLSRENKVMLRAHEVVDLHFGSDGLRFGVSVRDRFGALDFAGFRRGMQRCLKSNSPISQNTGGAGLGLYMLARSCQTLIFNVRQDQTTEVIALWDPRPRHNQHHSIYFFEEHRYQDLASQSPPLVLTDATATNPFVEDTQTTPPLLFDPPSWDDTTNRICLANPRSATDEDTQPNWIN